MKSEYGRQSAPGADSWHLESATSSLLEKGASNLPDSCKDVRDAKPRESEWKKSSEKGESPAGEEKWVRHWERASSRGRAEQEAPCHCIWQRSGVTTRDERARKPGSTAGEGRHRTKPLVPEAGPGGTNCAVKLLTEEAETRLILRRPRAAKVTP